MTLENLTKKELIRIIRENRCFSGFSEVDEVSLALTRRKRYLNQKIETLQKQMQDIQSYIDELSNHYKEFGDRSDLQKMVNAFHDREIRWKSIYKLKKKISSLEKLLG